MKNIYIKCLFLFSSISILYPPEKLQAQCTCSASVPATAIVQTLTIAPTTASTLTFNFRQFDPSLGTLNCVALEDTISGISYTGARNTGPTRTAFLFLLSLTSKISAPGISITQPFSEQYGYDTLAAYGQPGDTITYGPTNIIPNPYGSASGGSDAAYMGTGTVPITYSVNGGMITMDGGSNYKSSVTTTIGGTLKLTYYYCPSTLLASGFNNFSAYKKDKSIILTWDAQNAETIDQFEVEYSVNGKDFTSVARLAGNHAASGNYSYTYPVNSGSGDLYFRIKQTGTTGRSGYSAIQKISLNAASGTGMAIHPNPAITGMSISFDHLLSGDYSVELVNTSGQTILSKKLRLNATNIIPINWTVKPAPGIYFTRVTRRETMEQQIIRAVIQ